MVAHIIKSFNIGVVLFFLNKPHIGGEAMAMDAIQIVKEAEEKAREILETATAAAKRSAEEAVNKAEEEYQSIISNAESKAKLIGLKAIEEGETIAKPILDKGQSEVESLRGMEASKLEGIVDIIIERIVKTDGNS